MECRMEVRGGGGSEVGLEVVRGRAINIPCSTVLTTPPKFLEQVCVHLYCNGGGPACWYWASGHKQPATNPSPPPSYSIKKSKL